MTVSLFMVAVIATAVALSTAMSIGWALERRTGNAGWIDAAWSFGVGAVAAAAALVPLGAEADLPRRCLVALAVAIWSLRLGFHIAARTRRQGDDMRYAVLRQSFSDRESWRMWLLVQKQALVSIPLVIAVMLAAHHSVPGFRPQDGLAAIVFLLAFAGEALADHQLRHFRKQAPRGSICQAGLWRWSRHPNYFFEWLGWLGYPLIALDPGGQYPWGYLALLAPIVMYWLLVHVSGIPPLEAQMVKSRGDAYLGYQARTSAFFPLPPFSPPVEPRPARRS
jgi:steroid 5-alpha reductase family enzyme